MIIDEIKTVIADMDTDMKKFENGNASAGTRVRKDAMAVIKLCKDLREKVQKAKIEAKG